MNNNGNPFIKAAMEYLGEAIRSDPDYRNTWHANLSMMMQDEGVSKANADARAASFISMAFKAPDQEAS